MSKSDKQIWVSEATRDYVNDTQARILISGNGEWSHDQIIKTAMEKLREELKLEDKEKEDETDN